MCSNTSYFELFDVELFANILRDALTSIKEPLEIFNRCLISGKNAGPTGIVTGFPI